jgi:hypothetical protein
MKGAKFNKATGEIVAVVATMSQFELDAQATETIGVLACEDDVSSLTMWVQEDEFLPRETAKATLDKTVADIGEEFTLSGLPKPCWLFDSILMDDVEVTSGTYTTSAPSEQYVLLRLVGHYTGAFEIEVSKMAGFRSASMLLIDELAEAARSRVITPGSGQAMTYIRKADAARSFLAGNVVGEAQMSRLNDEASRLGITLEEAAESLVATADAWEGLDATIDNTRLTRKNMIEKATSLQEIQQIVDETVWPV